MTDTGAVVVHAPSARQQTTDRQGLDRTNTIPANCILTNGGTSSNPPLQPIHETNQHACNSDNSTHAADTTKSDKDLNKQHLNALNLPNEVKLEPPSISSQAGDKSQPMTLGINVPRGVSSEYDIKREPSEDVEPTNLGNSCASGQPLQVSSIKHDDTNMGDEVQETDEKLGDKRKQRDIEETIIDNFAICAFASWEDLQDEINDRIAIERAKQKVTANLNEKSSDNKSQPKKRSRPKKEKKSTEASLTKNESDNQTKAAKPKKKIKPDKKPQKDSHKKGSSNVQSSESLDGSKTTAGSTSSKKAAVSMTKKLATGKESPDDGSCSKKLPKGSKDREHDNTTCKTQIKQSEGTSNEIRTSESAQSTGQRSNQAHDQGPKTPQSGPYSSYGSNPHLSRLHDITSQTGQSMQRSYPVNFQDQKQSNSQSQQPNKPIVPPQQQAQPKPAQPNHQYQMPYHHPTPPPFMYPPPPPPPPHIPAAQPQRQSTSNVNQGNPYNNYYPTHGANPYFYPGPTTHQDPSHPTANSYAPQPSYANQQMPRGPYYGPYQGAQNPGYPQPISQPYHLSNPFSLYPQHLAHPQHSSAMSKSMSMSAVPSTYGSPYIVTDTTISRQTHIMPPMPTAFEQAAASTVNSKFGTYPSLINPMNHRGPSTTATPHRGPNPLYQSATERSFMELAKSYSNAHAGPPGYPGYISGLPPHSPALPATPAPSSSSTPSTGGPYGALDRWPRMSIDYSHERSTSRFSSLCYPRAPTLTPYSGPPSMRPPPFPTPLMFANIDAPGP